MDVRLSAEQRALADSATQLVDRLGPKAVGQLDDRERSAKLDAAVAASGWRELRTANDDGRPWASGVETAIVAEQLGRGLADAAFVGPTIAAELRRLAGAPTTSEPETTLFAADLSGIATASDRSAPASAVAVDAAGACTALLLRRAKDGWSLSTVALGKPFVSTDLTRAMAIPAPDATAEHVPDQRALLDDDALARTVALGLAITSADLVGTMRGALDLACEYAAQRRQYGRSIGSFQAVQHLLADALVATEGSRSVTLHAAWAVDALGAHDARVAGAVAKAYAARAARRVSETAIQVHGGIGNTWDCLAHVHLRRALLSSDLFGGVERSLACVMASEGIGAVDGLR
jgi:alkylation response protein AidB-like acyl-CoA dehydrogenase